MSRFSDRLAPNIDHPVEAAAAVRPPGTAIAAGIGAGVGAAIGSIGGGSALLAGVGAGVGVIVAYVFLWWRMRGEDQSLGMALVLAPDQLELYRLGMLSAAKPQGLLRAIPYSEISAVDERKRRLELVVTIIADSGPLAVTMPNRASTSETLEHLRRRIAA